MIRLKQIHDLRKELKYFELRKGIDFQRLFMKNNIFFVEDLNV